MQSGQGTKYKRRPKKIIHKDYGVTVTHDNVLHLVLRLSDLLFFVVTTCTGEEYRFHTDRHKNVGYLKQRIKDKQGFIDLEDQDLFCNNEKLDDQRSFHDLCNGDDDVIHLIGPHQLAKI
ncbi:hypothetical protein PIB30_045490 [Stylosanthes scabra]|uniref:Ubiquitin-like domain-containing protein n=1 Tax=Stylosanthes scabra TaxID=79078 RepID=A0ABU6YF33_9FABA|nr:hypothetical protein [Stylosanthes scabra]